MPSRVNDSASSRFELPALDLNFGSITDGTDIPPPPDSPVQKESTPPKTPVATTKATTQATPVAKDEAAVAPKQTTSNGKLAGTKRPADDIPPSPTASARPGSLRRLFSRNTLNNTYAEGQQQSNGNGTAVGSVQRPMSRSGSSFLDERKSKRSSGWFKRLTGDGATGRRSSLMLDESSPAAQNKPSGPPPPMIPELKEFEKEDTGFGSDLFKNIK